MILIAFGANMTGLWGNPSQSVLMARDAISSSGLARVRAFSALYRTAPLGPSQPSYVNAAAWIESALPATALLRFLKRLERDAGRRAGRRWGPRPLDLDILDYKGRIYNWRVYPFGGTPDASRALVLPHAGLHARPFALAPVAEIDPRWRHPVFHATASELLHKSRREKQGAVIASRV
ncbi:MAG: 2-amino-4-hydroxy-6-hydroxymethyldihydropteridine diphosphokinase [Hyphomicrobiales bacterium]|nr:2-amino-4-hydroxy-6-hydroxymethyldihydropteridine diphosphokinase [Hyphomicrobiales bacterium]